MGTKGKYKSPSCPPEKSVLTRSQTFGASGGEREISGGARKWEQISHPSKSEEKRGVGVSGKKKNGGGGEMLRNRYVWGRGDRGSGLGVKTVWECLLAV